MPNSPITRRAALRHAALSLAALPFAGAVAGRAESALPVPGTVPRTRGLKLGLVSYTLHALPLAGVIAVLKELRLDCVSLSKTHAPWGDSVGECRGVAQKFRDSGIAVMATGVLPLANDETALRKLFECGRAAGLPVITATPAPGALPLVERLVREYDIRIAIYNHGPGDPVYGSPRDVWRAVQSCDSRIGLCIDTATALRAGADVPEAIRTCGSRLYDFRLKDQAGGAGQADNLQPDCEEVLFLLNRLMQSMEGRVRR